MPYRKCRTGILEGMAAAGCDRVLMRDLDDEITFALKCPTSALVEHYESIF